MPRIEEGLSLVTGKKGREHSMALRCKEFEDAIQLRLVAFARTRGYETPDSLAKYLGCPVPKFAAEAAYMRDIVAETWARCYEIWGAVESGQRSLPPLETLLAELPVLAWPESH